MAETALRRVYLAKGSRVFVSAMLSLLVPLYLHVLGYTDFMVGAALVAILSGNALSNLALSRFERALGRRRTLLLFSGLAAVSGLTLAVSSYVPAGHEGEAIILAACFFGNASTTGTEAGPFQSVEAGVLPELAGSKEPVKAFGKYNLIGYASSAAGSLAAGSPGLFSDQIGVYAGLFTVYGLVGALLFAIYLNLEGLDSRDEGRPEVVAIGPAARRDLDRLSFLFAIDAFGGSFVSQYVLSYWFRLTYGVPSTGIGTIFAVTNIIVVVSVYAAAVLATRLGNLRTMFYTHLVSNLFLVAIPLAGSVWGSLALLFLRQSASQMDVPTRQALMAEMFGRDERVKAFALTNTARTIGTLAGSPATTAMFALGLLSGPIFAGGLSKMIYDFSIFGLYRRKFR